MTLPSTLIALLKKIENKINFSVRLLTSIVISFVFLKILFTVEKIKLFYAAGWPDPFIYFGYGKHFNYLQSHYGGTYYAARLSVIGPIWIREKIHLSFQNFRILELSIFTLGLTLIFIRENLKKFTLINLFMLSLTSLPIITRHFADDYTPSFVLIYLVWSTSLLVISSSKDSKSLPFFSGFIAFMALDANTSTALIIVPWMTIYLLSNRPKHVRRIIRYQLFGFLFAGILILIIGIEASGRTFLEDIKATIGAISRANVYDHLFAHTYKSVAGVSLYFAFLLMVSILILVKSAFINNDAPNLGFSNEKLIYSSTLASVLTVLIGMTYHIEHPAYLTWSFYEIFYFPILAFSINLFLFRDNTRMLQISVFIFIGFVLNFFAISILRNQFTIIQISRIRWYSFALVFCLLIIAFLTKMMFRPFAILSVIFLGSILPLTQDWNPYWYSASQNISNGEYRDFINVKSSILNAGVHRVIQKFDDLVKNEIPYNDYFWIMYPNSPNWLLSVDASVLYGYSCFNCQQNNGLTKARNFPSVSPAEIAILKQRQYVILFSDSVTSTKKAIDTLLLNQPKWKLQSQHNFASDDLELSVGIIKVAR